MVNDLVNTPFAPLTDLGRISSGVHMHNLAGFCLPSPLHIMTSLCNFLEEVAGVIF